jgi:hypothetical protein
VIFSFTISLIFKVRASLVWFFTISARERISCDLDCAPSLILYLVTVDLSRVTIFADFLFFKFISFFFQRVSSTWFFSISACERICWDPCSRDFLYLCYGMGALFMTFVHNRPTFEFFRFINLSVKIIDQHENISTR